MVGFRRANEAFPMIILDEFTLQSLSDDPVSFVLLLFFIKFKSQQKLFVKHLFMPKIAQVLFFLIQIPTEIICEHD